MKKVLVIDDEEDLLELISYNLGKEGFTVNTANSGAEGIKRAQQHEPDLILLDIMMPGMDGHDVCSRLKEDPALHHIPIIFLTARGDEASEVVSLDSGADDYLVKPITNRKLISRVNAVLRRYEHAGAAGDEAETVRINDIVIDRNRYSVTKADEELQLPRKEFEILYYMSRNPGRVFTREALLNEIWGNDIFVIDRTVDVHIRKIREKLGDEFIETVKGVGYRLKA